MKIKSAKSFREWYRTEKKQIDTSDRIYNENFMGTYHHPRDRKKFIKGFFEMYHGDKPDIATYLPSLLKIAEDGQAIYEFLQNAVDCNSTHFYIFYNEKYFLAINNGEPFDNEGIQAILNIAQTTKKSCDKIGRFGIGFKLVHRLVGKNEGVKELVNKYKGPVLFSWSKSSQLKSLLNREGLEPVSLKNAPELYDDAPYLLKMLLTNFPAQPGEVVKDLNYEDRVVFEKEELEELVSFLEDSIENHNTEFNLEDLNKGSLFFIKLGKGKKVKLDNDYNDLRKGVQYSMNMLKKLEKVYINSKSIGKAPLKIESFEIDKKSEEFQKINPEYSKCNIKISLGYYNNYKDGLKLKKSPNFYKYFPMGDENNGFNFILHSDAFSNESNRRKLQKDDVNKNLLPEIANFINQTLENYKSNNIKQAQNLYCNLLMSDIPNKENNDWLNKYFFEIILYIIRLGVPTQSSTFSKNIENVKIRKLNIDIDLHTIGLSHIDWFLLEPKEHSRITSEAQKKEKLGLESWDIRNVIENADTEKFNKWIRNLTEIEYLRLLLEINKKEFRAAAKEKLLQIELFKFSDDKFYSADESQKYNIIFNDSKTSRIKDILSNLGIVNSLRNISSYKEIFSLFKSVIPDDTERYSIISEACKENTLAPSEKKKLFLNFIRADTKFEGISDGTLKDLELFSNNSGKIKPLNKLVTSNISAAEWLKKYQIKKEEYILGLKKFLLEEDELYKEVIQPKWDKIVQNIKHKEIPDFYERVTRYFALNDLNVPLNNQDYIYVNEKVGFVSKESIFYNSKLIKSHNYSYLKNSIEKITNTNTPNKLNLDYHKQDPFRLGNTSLLELDFNKVELDATDIKYLLDFCSLNNENFFEQKIIIQGKEEGLYRIKNKKEDTFQVYLSKGNKEFFYKCNLESSLIPLTEEFHEYKKLAGVLRKEQLILKIVETIDVNDFVEEIIDILETSESKKQFIIKLSSIKIKVDKEYNSECFEFKILEWITNKSILSKEEDIVEIKEKIFIESGTETINLLDIPPSIDKIEIENIDLSLSQLLPDQYENSNYLDQIVAKCVSLGLSEKKLNDFFGLSSTIDIQEIFELIKTNYKIIQNSQQLAFIVLYNKLEDINLKDFLLPTLSSKEYSLIYSFYISKYKFIDESAVLPSKFNNIKEYLDLPFCINEKNGNWLFLEPYFYKNELIIPDFIESPDEETIISFLTYLFQKYENDIDSFKKHKDWSIINEKDSSKYLGFQPKISVYPDELAIEKEKLPNFITTWTAGDKMRIEFLKKLGVHTNLSPIGKLRQCLQEGKLFNDIKFLNELSEPDALFSTFTYMEENSITFKNEDEYELLKDLVNKINDLRTKNHLIIEDTVNFDILKLNSSEWDKVYYHSWKEKNNDKFNIYLYDHPIPRLVFLDEIPDYTIYEYNNGNIAIDKNNIYIYINSDINKTLSILISDDENEFFTEDLLALYQNKEENVNPEEEIKDYKDEINRLKTVIQDMNSVSGRDGNDITTQNNEYINELGKISETYLNKYLVEKYGDGKVIWMNYNEEEKSFVESWEQYDFKILDDNFDTIKYIDCKGTPRNKKTFYLSMHEWKFFLDCTQKGIDYEIYRVFNTRQTPNHIHIENLWAWIEEERLVPYLTATETIKGGKVFLTITE